MIDEPSRARVPAAETPAFRSGVSRMDRLRQRIWATRARLGLALRRDRGTAAPRRRGR